MTYSLDFRKKAFSIKAKEGLTFKETAERFGVGVASLVRWTNKLEPQKNRNKPATKINMQALKQDILDYPDAYQSERAERLGVSQMGICHALRRIGVHYKKNTSASQSRSRTTSCLLSKHSQASREGLYSETRIN